MGQLLYNEFEEKFLALCIYIYWNFINYSVENEWKWSRVKRRIVLVKFSLFEEPCLALISRLRLYPAFKFLDTVYSAQISLLGLSPSFK